MTRKSTSAWLPGPVLLWLAGCASLPDRLSEEVVAMDDGVRLWVRTFGSGEETVIIPLVTWNQKAFAAAAGAYRFVFYDPRSRGRSDAAETIGLERDLRDVDAVRRHFGLRRVHLIGTSCYGALLALYAARHPEAVDRAPYATWSRCWQGRLPNSSGGSS